MDSSGSKAADVILPMADENMPPPPLPKGNGNEKTSAVSPAASKDGQERKTEQPVQEPGVKDLLRVYSYATKLDVLLLVVGILASIASGVTMPLMNVVFGKLLGNFSSFGSGSGETGRFARNLNRQSLYIFILFLARLVLSYASSFTFRMTSLRLSAALRLAYLKALFAQSVHVLDTLPAGAAAATITTTANTLQVGISENNVVRLLDSTTTILASIVVAFVFSWRLSLVTMTVIVFILALAGGIVLPVLSRAEARITRAETRATSVVAETFNHIRTVMACGAESAMARRHATWVQVAARGGRSVAPALGVLLGSVFFSIYAVFALAFYYGARAYKQGHVHDISVVVIALMSVLNIIGSIQNVTTAAVALSKALVAAAQFFVVIDAPPPPHGAQLKPHPGPGGGNNNESGKEKMEAAPAVSASVSATQDIVFSGVDFAYPSRPHIQVLHGLDLRIEAGKINAIVGSSGSGKSTIIALIERWYSLQIDPHVLAKTLDKEKLQMEKVANDEEERQRKKKEKKQLRAQKEQGEPKSEEPKSEQKGKPAPLLASDGDHSLPHVKLGGSMTVGGGVNVDDVDLAWWRSQIGLVQQEPFLFNDTIYNNVAFGLVGSQFESLGEDQKRTLVEEACREAFADDFIQRLPDGYQTLVGDSGIKLSGGQRQRLAIARAIVKQPTILLLDEATSAIDVRSERIVQAALDRVSRKKMRTTVVVAHRLSTIRAADKICVLSHGRCVEEGTHDSLVANSDGVYAGLVRAQQLSLMGEKEVGEAGGSSAADRADKEATTSDLEQASGQQAADEVVETTETMETSTKTAATKGTTGKDDLGRAGKGTAWKQRGFFNSFGRQLYEQRSQFPVYAVLIGAAMAAASGPALQAYLFAKLVVSFGSLVAILQASSPASSSSSLPGLDTVSPAEIDKAVATTNHFALMFFVLSLGVGAAYCIMGVLAARLEEHAVEVYSQQYFAALLRQPLSFFDEAENAAGSLTSRVGGDPRMLRELLGINLGLTTSSVLTIVAALVVSFVFGWKLSLLAFAVEVPLVMAGSYYRLRYELQFEALNTAVFADSARWATESIDAVRTVTALTLEPIITARYAQLLDGHVTAAFRKARFAMVIFAISNSIALGCQSLVFWYGGHLVNRGEYNVFQFFVCYMAAIQSADAAGQSLSMLPNAAKVTAAANNILSVREMASHELEPPSEPAIPDGGCADTAGGSVDMASGNIEFCNVHFRYPTRRDVLVLRGLNLAIENGQFAAIVGASGSGKTTVISLLERFYDIDEGGDKSGMDNDNRKGRILVNGAPIRSISLQAHRRMLSLVAQEPALFQGTVRENLLLGLGDAGGAADDDDASRGVAVATLQERIVQACRDAAIDDFVMSLPDGYDTDLGSRAGVSLSGGQKQRLSIARALLRKPRVLLLDEATSSLDSETEKQIQATFERVARRGRSEATASMAMPVLTTIAVAHRLSTIQHADIIFVLSDGRVVEQGSHAELLRQRGVYWSMCQNQALDR